MSDFDKWLMKNNDKDQCADWSVVRKAWNHQQKKIDSVLNYLKGCECSLDVDIDSIKELLK